MNGLRQWLRCLAGNHDWAVLDADAYKLFESRYNHEVENWVDRLARVLVEIGGCVE